METKSTTSSVLVQQFEKHIDELGAKFLKFAWEQPEVYADWLAQTYYFVRHTTTFISLASARFGADNREKHYGLLGHLKDEVGHDLILLNDLRALDRDTSEFSELPETSLFYQNQFYMLERLGPASHLGYSLCLEGVAAKYCPAVYQKLVRLYGESAADFINVHANVDVDHYAKGLSELGVLTDGEAQAVLKNLEQSAILYGLMLEKIVSRSKGKSSRHREGPKSA